MKKITFLFSLILLTLSFAFGQDTIKVKIYNEDANPTKEILNAIKKASLEKKNVLIQLGGNWCSWCILFDKLTKENKKIKDYLSDNYKVVHVNYSPKNKNEKMLAVLKHPERFGFPVFAILDSNGNLVHTQNSAYLESKEIKGYDTKLVLEFLQSWSYKALDPATYSKN